MPVRTPGPSVRSGAFSQRWATRSHSTLERRHGRRETDSLDVLQVEQRRQRDAELVAGPIAVGGEPKMIDELLVPIETEGGLRVPDVDSEQHGATLPSRARTNGQTGHSSTVAETVADTRAKKRSICRASHASLADPCAAEGALSAPARCEKPCARSRRRARAARSSAPPASRRSASARRPRRATPRR